MYMTIIVKQVHRYISQISRERLQDHAGPLVTIQYHSLMYMINFGCSNKTCYYFSYHIVTAQIHVAAFVVKLPLCILHFLVLMLIYILKELKYATHKNSTVTYVFDVVMKSLLNMSCRLLVACDEM